MSVSSAFTQKYLNQYVQSPSNGYTLVPAGGGNPTNLTLAGTDLVYPYLNVRTSAELSAASTLTFPAAADILTALQSSTGASPAQYPWVVPCDITVENEEATELIIAQGSGGNVVNASASATLNVSTTTGDINRVARVSVVMTSATAYNLYVEGAAAP